MNKIEELIEKLCPEGVEYQELGQVYEFKYGTGNTIPTIGGQYPVYGSNGIVGTHNEYNSEDAPLIGHIGAYAGIVNWRFGKHFVTYNGVICKLKNNQVLHKYAFYQLLLQDFLSMAHSGSQPFVSYGMLNKVQIPIPPLPIQQEIVSILDKFNQLQSELQAELQARARQYEYYRNELFNFDGKEVEWKTVGEVGQFIRGNGMPKSDFTESGIGCIHYGQIYTFYGTFTDKTKSFVSPETAKKLQKVQKNDLIISNTSENMEDVCKTVVWLGENEIVTGGHATIFKHKENPIYLAYYTQTSMFFSEKIKYARGAKVIDIKASDLAKIKIPIPPLAEQERIVAILDKFDKLVNDISEGLPADIKARQKQYEYYRSKLLNFKMVNSQWLIENKENKNQQCIMN